MKMKRIIALLTALVLALALTACGETKPTDDVQQGGDESGKTYKVAIIKQGRLIASGTMDEVKGDQSLEAVFLELEGEKHA